LRVYEVFKAFQAYHDVEIAITKWELVFHIGVHKLRALPLYVSGNNNVSVLTKLIGKQSCSGRYVKNSLNKLWTFRAAGHGAIPGAEGLKGGICPK
jgi:hypothetical protein